MPPSRLNDAFSRTVLPPFWTVMAPLADTDGTLKE